MDGQAAPEVRISVGRGLKIAGLVKDADGMPVEGAEVRAAGRVLRSTINGARTVTDAKGHFELIGLPTAESQRLVITHVARRLCGHIDVAPPEAEAAAPSNRAIALGVTLQPAVRVVGKVVDAKGPVEGATIYLHLHTGEPTRIFTMDPVKTDKDGRYVFEFVEPEQECTLSVQMQGYVESRRDWVAPRFKPKAGETFEPEKIVLLPLDKSVSGVVVDADGKPIAGMRIRALAPGAALSNATSVSDEEGRFTLRGLPDAELRLSCSVPDGSDDPYGLRDRFIGSFPARPGQTDLQLVITAEALRRGREPEKP